MGESDSGPAVRTRATHSTAVSFISVLRSEHPGGQDRSHLSTRYTTEQLSRTLARCLEVPITSTGLNRREYARVDIERRLSLLSQCFSDTLTAFSVEVTFQFVRVDSRRFHYSCEIPISHFTRLRNTLPSPQKVFFVLVGSLFGRTSVVFSDLFYRRYVDHALSKSDRGKKVYSGPAAGIHS